MNPLSPTVPFAPARTPFFYGWFVVGVGALGIVMSIPGQTMGVSVFTDPLMVATGLSRLQLANTYLVGTLTSSLLLPLGGRLLDRFGARLTAMAACIALGLTLCLLASIDRVADALAPLLGAQTAALFALSFGFLCVRFSGQGMLTVSSRTMMSKWFEARRGLATGISGTVVAFGFGAAPAGLQLLIDAHGWRWAWLLLGGAAGIGMTAIAWLFYRDNPEECGLRMDGRDAPAADSDAPEPIAEEPEFTRDQALRTAVFWAVTLALAINAMVFTGITFHIVDLGREMGLDATEAVSVFLPIAIVSTLSRLISGWASDRVSVRPLVLVMLAAQAVSFIGFGRLSDPFFMMIAIAAWGTTAGLYSTLLGVAMPNLFGRLHLGAISGFQMSCMVAGSAAGPAALALAERSLGSYREGLLLCCGLSAACFVFASVTRQPGRGRTR